MADRCLEEVAEVKNPPSKKLKVEDESTSETNSDSIHNGVLNLSAFEFKRILNINPTRKQICVEGVFKGRESPAVVVLEKKSFPIEELFLKRGFFNESTILRKVYHNDIYGSYECFPTREHNGLNATVIHPATEKHVDKYKRKELYIVNETYELYQQITLPHIESKQFSLEWVDNILQHKAESDRIVYEDKDKDIGFIMIPDLKWDGEPAALNMLVLPFQRLKSIRELNETHLPLLRNIRDAGSKIIHEKFQIAPSQLRIYFHYQPSYYHLHVHFTYLMFETPGIYAEKAHLLSTVISNLELMPDYYQKATLPFVVFEGDALCTKFQDSGVIQKSRIHEENNENESDKTSG